MPAPPRACTVKIAAPAPLFAWQPTRSPLWEKRGRRVRFQASPSLVFPVHDLPRRPAAGCRRRVRRTAARRRRAPLAAGTPCTRPRLDRRRARRRFHRVGAAGLRGTLPRTPVADRAARRAGRRRARRRRMRSARTGLAAHPPPGGPPARAAGHRADRRRISRRARRLPRRVAATPPRRDRRDPARGRLASRVAGARTARPGAGRRRRCRRPGIFGLALRLLGVGPASGTAFAPRPRDGAGVPRAARRLGPEPARAAGRRTQTPPRRTPAVARTPRQTRRRPRRTRSLPATRPHRGKKSPPPAPGWTRNPSPPSPRTWPPLWRK